MDPQLSIIHEDAELLVVNKPAGLVCHPTKGDAWSSLISRIRLHLAAGGHPHLINRLDRETSGIVVVAKTDVAALELRQIWETRAVTKEYLAIVEGSMSSDKGVIAAPLGRDEQSRVAIKDCVRQGGSPAQTEFRVLRRFERDGSAFSLLRVLPFTGRKHQIRIHLAHLGYSIVGDKIYGPDEDLYLALVEDRLTKEQRRKLRLPYQALHAERLRFLWRGVNRDFHAPPEAWFTHFCGGLSLPETHLRSLQSSSSTICPIPAA